MFVVGITGAIMIGGATLLLTGSAPIAGIAALASFVFL